MKLEPAALRLRSKRVASKAETPWWLSGAIATAARPSPVRRLRRGRPYGARRLGGGIAFEACCCVGTRRDVERQAQAPLSVPAIKTLRLFALRRPSYLAAAAISSLLRVGRRSMRREPKANSNLFRANNRTVLLPSDRSRNLCSCWLRLPSLRSVVTPLCTSLHQARASLVRASPEITAR